jgi:hypothetical protein
MTVTKPRSADKHRAKRSFPKATGPAREPVSITVRVGLFNYSIELADEVWFEGRRVQGLTNATMNRIALDRNYKPARRWATLWHELAHVWQFDMDPDRMVCSRNQAHIVNLIAMGMACMDPTTYLKLWAFVMHEQVIDDAAIFEPVQPAFDEPPMKLQAPA